LHTIVAALVEFTGIFLRLARLLGGRRSKSELTTAKRASATAASLQGRLRANKRRGGGGGKARNTYAQERNFSITITQNHSSTV
jgi:hypothetical protein